LTIPSSQIAYLFKDGRRARLGEVIGGLSPQDFYYGFLQLRNRGFDVTLIEESDLDLAIGDTVSDKVLASLSTALLGLHGLVIYRLCKGRSRNLLNGFDTVIATTNLQTICLGVARRLGFVRCRVIGIGMGIMPKGHGGLRGWLVRWALCGLDLMLLSQGEQRRFKKAGGHLARTPWLPFGIDVEFWRPDESTAGRGGDAYVLSIGNDINRDYATLTAAWRPEFPNLKIMTRLPVKTTAQNIEVMHSDWFAQVFTDGELRKLIRNALFVIVPVRQTIQPSGQSACLQAMACGKAVVLSDIDGLWDRDNMIDQHNCILVPPGSVDALSESVAVLLADPARLAALGAAARRSVEGHFNLGIMTDALQKMIEDTNHATIPHTH
jgi:glycosyltransferase involved in cell wall biosynthesis